MRFTRCLRTTWSSDPLSKLGSGMSEIVFTHQKEKEFYTQGTLSDVKQITFVIDGT